MADTAIETYLERRERRLPDEDDLAPESVPHHVVAGMYAERERLAAADEARARARATGWCGPYRVQVFTRTANDSFAGGRMRKWGIWADQPNSHDRLGTAFARCKALVHGLPDGVRPGWYGDQRSALGAYESARVVDASGRVVARAERDA